MTPQNSGRLGTLTSLLQHMLDPETDAVGLDWFGIGSYAFTTTVSVAMDSSRSVSRILQSYFDLTLRPSCFSWFQSVSSASLGSISRPRRRISLLSRWVQRALQNLKHLSWWLCANHYNIQFCLRIHLGWSLQLIAVYSTMSCIKMCTWCRRMGLGVFPHAGPRKFPFSHQPQV